MYSTIETSFNRSDYFNWLVDRIHCNEFNTDDYTLMLNGLMYTTFRWSVGNDDNRAADGIELRRLFAQQYAQELTESILSESCSLLEMMIGLAIRCETDITGDPGNDHPERWFWIMAENCGLTKLDNDNFSRDEFDKICHVVLDREYDSFGHGGLFSVKSSCIDMREAEIWAQLNQFLTENYEF